MEIPKLHRNQLVPAIVLTVGALAAACTPQGKEIPSPATTTTQAPAAQRPKPSCDKINVIPGAGPRTFSFTLDLINQNEPGEWGVDYGEFLFGDGTFDQDTLAPTHTYPGPGSYTVQAMVEIEVSEGATPPFKQTRLPCEPVTVPVP